MKQCPECGELLGNGASECFKCGRNVEDEYGTDYASKYKSYYVPPINGPELFLCIIQPGGVLIMASCACLFAKKREFRRFVMPASIVMAIILTFAAIVSTPAAKILAGVMIIPPLLVSIGMKIFGKKDFKESLESSCMVVGAIIAILGVLTGCYLIYLYLHELGA